MSKTRKVEILLASLILFLAFMVRIMQLKVDKVKLEIENRKLSNQIETLISTQNVMVWTMDKSCYDQIKNSGILRLKTGKE